MLTRRTLLIVDDSRIFQKITERILTPYYSVVGKGASGLEGFELYKKLKPDVVLMDITMPHCSGKECLFKILQFDPLAKVVMVSSLSDDATVSECLTLGAKGFVRKEEISNSDADGSVLVQTVKSVVAEEDKSEAV